jgi:phospholipid transport system substrate-binding protein
MNSLRWVGRILAGGLMSLAILSVPAAQAQDPAAQLIESSVAEAMAIIYDQPSSGEPLSVRVRPVLEKSFDFEYATRSAIGPGWRQLSAEQQKRAVQLFTDLVIRTYADRFEPKSRPTITWGKPRTPADKRREIPSTITYEGQTYAVDYKLRETPAGWRVYDVVAENVSMIANYRAQFEELFRKGGVDAIMQALENNQLQAVEPKKDNA